MNGDRRLNSYAKNNGHAAFLIDVPCRWSAFSSPTFTSHAHGAFVCRHYFTDGLYPDATNLKAAAEEAGLDGAAAVAFAEDQEEQRKVRYSCISVLLCWGLNDAIVCLLHCFARATM